jgi:hypothetical protein
MITRAQIRRQLRAQGGITNTVPREGFIFGGITKRLRKLIPNELASVASVAAPFVAPFNPAVAAAMAGIGGFDRTGSLGRGLKSAALTYGGGQAARVLGGAGLQGNPFQSGGAFRGGLEGFKGGFSSPLGSSNMEKVFGKTPIKNVPDAIGGGATEGLLGKLGITEGAGSLKLTGLGKISAGALASYFVAKGATPEEAKDLTSDVYRGEGIGFDQIRADIEKYRTGKLNRKQMFDKNYRFLVPEGSFQAAKGGRAGYQTGGVTMANTYAQNIAANQARAAANEQLLNQARARIGIPAVATPTPVIPAPVTPAPVTPAPVTPAPVETPVSGGSIGNGLGGLLPDLYEKVVPKVTPIEEEPKVIPIKSDMIPIPLPGGGGGFGSLLPGLIGDVLDQDPDAFAPQPILEESDEGTIGPITKLPVEPDPNTPIEELIDGPMTDEEILAERELNPPTSPGFDPRYEGRYAQDPGQINKIPVGGYKDPLPTNQLMSGFEEYKKTNPPGSGTMALVPVTLPNGEQFTFRNGAEAAAFAQYLQSIGQAPYQGRQDPEMLAKLAEGGKPSKRGNPAVVGEKMVGDEMREFMIMNPNVEDVADYSSKYKKKSKKKKKVKKAKGGMMSIPTGNMRKNSAGVMERDYRDKGGFVPVGIKEKADDVPAMLSKNEFVMTADAVRGAGGGSIDKGAQKMYNTMKRLEGMVK